jgi:nitrous oxidase accessory protein
MTRAASFASFGLGLLFTLGVSADAANAAAASETPAALIVVSPNGPVRSLGDAVRHAAAGSRIVVRAGTYREQPIVIDRPLTIVGEGRPLIEAAAPATLIRVIADDVRLEGLVLTKIEPSHVEDRAGVRFEHVTRCAAERLEVLDAPYGIQVFESSECRLAGNTIHGAGARQRAPGNAIHLWNARRMTLIDNVVSGHRDGLYFEFVQDATIERNVSERNLRYGLHFMFSHGNAYRWNRFERNGAGVAVMYTHDVVIEHNDFRDNRGPTAYGLLLKDISETRLHANRFQENTVGLLIEGGGRLTMTANRFLGNGWGVKLMANSVGNRFEGNVFDRNSFDMTTNSRSTEAVVSGNWWDRYTGYDFDRNGRGDIPFRPVRLFSLLVATNPSSVVLMRSTFVDLLDAAERTLPVLTPNTLVDPSPLMEMPPMEMPR